MNQDSLTNSTVLKSKNDELILKLCWDAWAFGSITTTKIKAIATANTITTTTTTAATAATFATIDNAAAADNCNTINFTIAVNNTISATTTTVTTTNNNNLNVFEMVPISPITTGILFLYYTWN